MPEMKDSGIEWIGEIPEDWDVRKGKYAFVQKSDRGNSKALVLLSPTQNYGVIPQTMYEELSGFSAVKLNEKTDYNSLKTVHKGAFVISLRSFQGGFEYSEYEGVVSPAYQVFYPSISVCDGYYKYLFKSKAFIEKMNSYTMSLRDGKNIAFDDFGRTYLPLPNVITQKRIADFLDSKCAEIDALIADIEKEIALLEEYKKSIITEAVTKGLDPSVEMKDSGIEWIGMIPKDWKMSRVKFHYELVLGKMLCSVPLNDTYSLESYYSAIDVHFDGISIPNKQMWFSPNEKKQYKIQPGDVLIVEGGAGAGGCSIAPECDIECYMQNSIIRARGKYNNANIYLCYVIQSIVQRGYIGYISNVATIPHFTKEKISNVFIPLLSEQEINEIITFLDEKCSEIDTLIKEKQNQLTLLADYKKSLIYEYVTGKKEVPADAEV